MLKAIVLPWRARSADNFLRRGVGDENTIDLVEGDRVALAGARSADEVLRRGVGDENAVDLVAQWQSAADIGADEVALYDIARSHGSGDHHAPVIGRDQASRTGRLPADGLAGAVSIRPLLGVAQITRPGRIRADEVPQDPVFGRGRPMISSPTLFPEIRFRARDGAADGVARGVLDPDALLSVAEIVCPFAVRTDEVAGDQVVRRGGTGDDRLEGYRKSGCRPPRSPLQLCWTRSRERSPPGSSVGHSLRGYPNR